jgi:L-fuculose-phosphate aldolase
MEQSGIRSRVCVVGHEMFRMGMQTERSGNISTLIDQNRLLITRRGSSLRMLHPVTDLVEVNGEGDIPAEASSETRVHLAIYRDTAHKAIVHAHPHYAIAISFKQDLFIPVHNEGRDLLGNVAIVPSTSVEGAGEGETAIVSALRTKTAVIVRGHGVFCCGPDVESAFYCATLLESSCKIWHLARMLPL